MNWRTPITLLVLLGVLLGAAYYGWESVISPNAPDKGAADRHKRTCTHTKKFHKGQLIRSSNVLVNVYNAGTISGLAGATLDALADNGFKRGVAENAPARISAANVTILAKDRRAPQVRLVAMQFRGKVRVSKGPPLAPGVDVIVGDGFRAVNTDAKSVLRLRHAVTTCTKTKRPRA